MTKQIEISVVINNVRSRLVVRPGDRLLDVLRSRGYFGAKRGCETGECGACTVLLDGLAVNSCLQFAAMLDGSRILTIEGAQYHQRLLSLQKEFARCGAIQCGFCVPGMLLSGSVNQNETPRITEDSARHMLRGNLCRCGSYGTAISLLSASTYRSQSRLTPSTIKIASTTASRNRYVSIGHSLPKIDSYDLVSGKARFTDDINIPNLLHGKILRSPHAHALIKNIDVSSALRLNGVHCVLTHKDVSRVPHTTAGQVWPEPSPYDTYLLDRKVRFVGDRVAIVAAESSAIAEEAAQRIKVEYDVLPSALDAHDAILPSAPQIHDESDSEGIEDPRRNIAARIVKETGNVEVGFAATDVVIESEFETQRVQHCSLEPHVAVSWLDERDRLTIRTSTQVPFHIRRQLARVLSLPIDSVRVIQPYIGGGFGGKQEMVLEDACGALTLTTKRPVKIEYTRQEEFLMSRSRHPQTVQIKLGARRDGTLVAIQMNVLATTGAYGSHAVTVQGNTGSKVLSLYRAPHKRYECRVVYTNTPISGAFRGYGCPQGFFALESALNELADKLKIDPLEIRGKNCVHVADVDRLTFAGELGHPGRRRTIRSCGLPRCLELAGQAIQQQRTRRTKGLGPVRKGYGLACALQGSGISGVSWSSAWIRLEENGAIVVNTGASDIGTGAHTVLSQIAAEVIGVTPDRVLVRGKDTDQAPFDVGAYASGTTVVAGEAVKKAAEKLRQKILRVGARLLKVKMSELHCKGNDVVHLQSGRRLSVSEVGRRSTYEYNSQIMAGASYCAQDSPPPFCAQAAEVEVDIDTGKIRVIQLTTVVDLGYAINPALAVEQINGAVTQGLGFALCEKMILDRDGLVVNSSFRDYHIFRSVDMPKLRTILVESNEPKGPFGAKAVGEVAINVVAPAIANAIHDAIGIRFRQLPITSEAVWQSLQDKHA